MILALLSLLFSVIPLGLAPTTAISIYSTVLRILITVIGASKLITQ